MDVKIYRNTRRNSGHVGGFIFEIKKHVLTIILYVIVFVGLILGNFVIKETPDVFAIVKSIFESFVLSVSGQTLFRSFIVQFTANVSVILLNFVFGLCAIGFPMPFFASFLKGISIGALSSFLYSEHGLSGFGFCMLVFFPVQLITTLILIFSGKESVRMSLRLLKILTEQNLKAGERYELKKYIFQFVLWIVITVIISFVSAVLNVYVVRLFDF